MSVLTIECIVEGGRIQLPDGVVLPENSKVYVVVPDAAAPEPQRMVSPRLVRREQLADFTMTVREQPPG